MILAISGISSSAEPLRVAAPVDPLVVRQHDLGDRAVHPEVAQHVGAQLGVALDRHPVLVGQGPAPLGDAVRQREVADVVQQTGGVRELASAALIPTASAMSRAKRATAAAWRAARPSRMSSERIRPASTPQDSDTYCSERLARLLDQVQPCRRTRTPR